MRHEDEIRGILAGDKLRWDALDIIRSLGRPDCWIGAGFIRNAVWDHLHGRSPTLPRTDVDVLWFDPQCADPSEDQYLESILRSMQPNLDWSVKNQARMHTRNGNPPYAGSVDALRFWPETATAVAVRRTGPRHCEVAAPFGLDDLFGLIVRPTPRFAGEKRSVYLDRVSAKGWLAAWPGLRMTDGEGEWP